jgi:hypothetical protein
MPSLVQAATKVTKHARSPRTNTENFMIGDYEAGSAMDYTAGCGQLFARENGAARPARANFPMREQRPRTNHIAV